MKDFVIRSLISILLTAFSANLLSAIDSQEIPPSPYKVYHSGDINDPFQILATTTSPPIFYWSHDRTNFHRLETSKVENFIVDVYVVPPQQPYTGCDIKFEFLPHPTMDSLGITHNKETLILESISANPDTIRLHDNLSIFTNGWEVYTVDSSGLMLVIDNPKKVKKLNGRSSHGIEPSERTTGDNVRFFAVTPKKEIFFSTVLDIDFDTNNSITRIVSKLGSLIIPSPYPLAEKSLRRSADGNSPRGDSPRNNSPRNKGVVFSLVDPSPSGETSPRNPSGSTASSPRGLTKTSLSPASSPRETQPEAPIPTIRLSTLNLEGLSKSDSSMESASSTPTPVCSPRPVLLDRIHWKPTATKEVQFAHVATRSEQIGLSQVFLCQITGALTVTPKVQNHPCEMFKQHFVTYGDD